MDIQFTLNDRWMKIEVQPDWTLLRFLRDQLRLTGTKYGCGEGHCGACTVIVNGNARRACLLKMSSLAEARIETIEGLGTVERLHPVQEAFIEFGCVQCGYCTPGLIMATKALLDRNPSPSREDIQRTLAGNLCRCGGYLRVIEAVQTFGQKCHPEGFKMSTAFNPVVGKSVEKKEARLKVTGQMMYAGDRYMEGMLHGKILWAAHPHAEIQLIDVSQAAGLPGVKAVLTAKDVPGINDVGAGQPVLADPKVRFIGDPVAVVFAETEEQAESARDRIKVDYRPFEGVFSPLQALDPGVPAIHSQGNLDVYKPFHKGDMEAGFAQADLIVEQSYYTPFVEHGYIETEAGLAAPEKDGSITIWICTQQPRFNRDIVADCLNLPKEKLRIAEIPCGGSFGGKWTISIHALLGLGALYTQRPVKIVLSRKESMRMHLKRNAVHLEYKTGVRKDGFLTALQIKIISDQGAYSPIGEICLEQMMVFAAGPYHIPNVKIDGYSVFTNKVPGGAMRGFGVNMVAFAMESQMDILARRLGMDPFEFRRLNALEPGRATLGGQILHSSVPIKQCLKEAQKLVPERPIVSAPKKIGLGMAVAFKNVGGGGSSGAIAELNPSGEVLIRIECPDVGQGSNTILAQIAAQTLGINYERVSVLSGDTHEAPPTGFTGAQRVTINAGNATVKACQALKEKILSWAADYLGNDRAQMEIDEGQILDRQNNWPLIAVSEVARKAAASGTVLSAEEYYHMPPVFPLSPTGNTDQAVDPAIYANYPTYSYMVHVALVEVDPDKGKVKVLKVIAVHDAGKMINPLLCRTQIEGAIMMGLGYALQEEFVIREGWNTTDSLRKCKIPTIKATPEIEVVLIEDPEPLGPFQAKGLSEAATVAVTPAIINAIYDATGIRVTELPASPERILKLAGR